MHFRLEFDCDNAAFGEDASERNAEIAHILRRVSAQLLDMVDEREAANVYDTNGNFIGHWELTNDEENGDD